MKIARIPLLEYSRFHFGELKMDDNLALSTSALFAHSDTLFSALVHGYAKHNGDAENFAGEFQNGSIKISSLFYYVLGNEQYVYFLPKPLFLDINSPKSKDGKHKLRNRIKFVSLGVWENGFEEQKWTVENGGYKIIDNLFVLTDIEYNSLKTEDDLVICKNVLSPKSPIRAHDNAAIYYQADVEIGNNSNLEIGWYFMYKANDENEKQLKIATNIMAYSGIGGEIHNTGRTVRAHPEFDTISLGTVKSENPNFINVSLFCPENEVEFKYAIHYSTILRGGRKLPHGGNAKVIRMIEEGALLSNEAKGRIETIGNDGNGYPILRNGIPILIPVDYDS